MDLNIISDSEWEIMRLVWAKAPVTSTVIIGDLEVTKGWMPTTTKTFLSRLVKKDLLKFEKVGRLFYYTSLVSEEKCVQNEIQSVIDKVYGGILAQETDHFTVKGNADYEYIKDISRALEGCYDKITDDLEIKLDQRIQAYIHTTQRGLHSALGLLEGPSWLRAGHIWGLLHLAPRSCFTDLSAEQVAVHTFILVLVQKINPTIPYWLQQAVATYFSGWMTQEKIRALNLHFDNLPDMMKDYSRLSSYLSFKEVHGYEWGFTVIDYIVKQYGKKKLSDFLRTPSDYKGVFGVTEEVFWEGWRNV